MHKSILVLTICILLMTLSLTGCNILANKHDSNSNAGARELETDLREDVLQKTTEMATEKATNIDNEEESKMNEDTSKATYYDTGDVTLNELCDSVLDEIVNSDMSEREQAYAVYNWVTENVRYRRNQTSDGWIDAAIKALSIRGASCFGYYSSSRALLTRLGFENIVAVARNNGHYWNMVVVEGFWWHFDTTKGWGTERFLWTSSQLLDYSYYNKTYGHDIIYKWDPEGYPETP